MGDYNLKWKSREKVTSSKEKNPVLHAQAFQFITLPHYREPGSRGLSSPWVFWSQRVLQPPHINRILPNKIITRAPPSSWCPAPGAKPLKQGQQAGSALPLLAGHVRPAGWSDSVAAATQGHGLFRNPGF